MHIARYNINFSSTDKNDLISWNVNLVGIFYHYYHETALQILTKLEKCRICK